jgi:type III pantothenate kinase
MVGARHRYRGPVCIVDCGTAVTLDVLDAEGRHLGGVILPGLRLMRDALLQGTSRIAVAEETVRLELARDTAAAVGSGAAYAVCSTVERVLHDVAGALQEAPRCVLCGGDAARLVGSLRYDCDLEEDLVLQGLAVIVADR